MSEKKMTAKERDLVASGWKYTKPSSSAETSDWAWSKGDIKDISTARAANIRKAESGELPSLKKAEPDSYAKGGMVKKTGMALVHKGEKVLTKKQVEAQKKKGK